MKKTLVLLLGVCFVGLLVGSIAAREAPVRPPYRMDVHEWIATHGPELNEAGLIIDPGLRSLYESAVADTYQIVWYDFETAVSPNLPAGWTKRDGTAQIDTFFHVEDFFGLGGGHFGLLVPLEGDQSMWCGVKDSPTADPFCGWINLPGYGNLWTQYLGTDEIEFQGLLHVSYTIEYDLEGNYDYVTFQYDAGNGAWTDVDETAHTYQGVSIDSFALNLTKTTTKLRFEFLSDQLVSDQDGELQSDGGCIVDSIRVWDDGLTFDDYEDFEDADVGDHAAGIWQASNLAAFGKYSGIMGGLRDYDICNDNLGKQVVFFIGSPYPDFNYPGLFKTPFCKGGGGILPPCQAETIISPRISMEKYSLPRTSTQTLTIDPGDMADLGGADLRVTVYGDLPTLNLVYWQWEVRRIHLGCPTLWLDREYVYGGVLPQFVEWSLPIGDFVSGTDSVQVAVGITDMCDVWYVSGDDCADHTPTPWIDNVRLYRYKTTGPQYSYRPFEFFQDNFPISDKNMESYVRADEGQDISNDDIPAINPGDSICVEAVSLVGGGIDSVGGSPAVYLHVRTTYIGTGSKPVLSGDTLAGSCMINFSTPQNFKYVGMEGAWTIIQFEGACSAGSTVPTPDKYCVDLNDTLFTRGYLIDYYVTAKDKAGDESSFPRYARSGPPYFEFTTLPTLVSDVLYVDDVGGNAETYWMPVFEAVLAPPNNMVDKYDVIGAGSGVDNGPGSRATAKQLDVYKKIVWDSGIYNARTISDGNYDQSDKSNDCQLLIDWMEGATDHPCGLWVCGDGVAEDMDMLGSTGALTLMNIWCGVDFVHASYYFQSGLVRPLVTGDASAGLFVHSGTPDKFYLEGGCPGINEFDVLQTTEQGKDALDYPPVGVVKKVAGITSQQNNDNGMTVRTVWFGFSFQNVRDDVISSPLDRFELAEDVFTWFDNEVNDDVSGDPTPKSYNLAQNFPNPFNPSTSIKFDMKEKGFVALKVYNVAGQLVRTLVNDTKDAGSHAITWDGKNNRGGAVASGIYFYKMETKDFSQTKKMVMLR
jgi:hypothetical protein